MSVECPICDRDYPDFVIDVHLERGHPDGGEPHDTEGDA